jgi:hypothetical protein
VREPTVYIETTIIGYLTARANKNQGDILLFLAEQSSALQKWGMPRITRASVGGICYHVINAIGGSENLVRRVNPVYLSFRALWLKSFVVRF